MQLGTYLKRRGIHQRVFASVIGVSPAYVSHLVAGNRLPSLEVAIRIQRHTRRLVQAGEWLTGGASPWARLHPDAAAEVRAELAAVRRNGGPNKSLDKEIIGRAVEAEK